MAARGVGCGDSAGAPRTDNGVLLVSAVPCYQTRNVVRWGDHIAEESMGAQIWVGCRDWNVAVVYRRALLIYVTSAAEGSRVAEAVQHESRVVD
jgi:hypothetical protein